MAVAVPGMAIAGYYAFLRGLPACGPPQDTALGNVYWFVPVMLLVVESVTLLASGMQNGRVPAKVLIVSILAAVVTLTADVGIWLHFFVIGHCSE